MLARAFINDLISIRIRIDITVVMLVSTARTEEKVVSMRTATLLLLEINKETHQYETLKVPWLFASIFTVLSTIFIRLNTTRNSFALRTYSFNYR